jgi:ABC-2 type transport system permease protein
MKKYLRLERIFISQYLKQLMEYKGDFLVGIVGVFLTQGLNILFLTIIFSQIPNLQGWSFKQIIFIYGFSLLPKGIDHLFFDNLWLVSYFLVRKGDFDKYLTRPINTLFYVSVEIFQVDAFGELLVGILLLVSSVGIVQWTLFKGLLFLLILPFATSIYTSLKIMTASLAFWTKTSGSITQIFYMINDFAKYPTQIFNAVIRFIISFIVPFAFTAYYPASYFLDNQHLAFNIGGLIIVSLLLFLVARLFWQKGIAAYESSGS